MMIVMMMIVMMMIVMKMVVYSDNGDNITVNTASTMTMSPGVDVSPS